MRRLFPDTFTMLLIAAVCLATLAPISGVWAQSFGLATKLAIALLFFLHGARLPVSAVVEGFLNWRLQAFILATTFVVFPLLGLLMGLLPGWIIPPALYPGLLFLCLLPSTVQSSIAFTSIAGGNVPAAICGASVSNIAGMFLTPLLVAALFSVQQQNGFSWGMLQDILLQLFAPFVGGQLLQPFIGGWIRARKKLLNPVDRGSILMVVYLAFSHAVIDGIWQKLSVWGLLQLVAIDAALLAIVLIFTTLSTQALGFSRADRIAAVFCGSKKSLASGVPIAGVIFAGQSAGFIVLPLMLFHQIQLMVCAWIARHYAAEAGAPHPSRSESAEPGVRLPAP